MDIQLPEGLRPAAARDWKQLGDITAEAFAQDPVNLWIFGNTQTMPPVFRTLARRCAEPWIRSHW